MTALTCFDLPQRTVLEVRGEDRVRWLNGMVSNEVSDLAGAQNGCRAALLSRQGRVLADLHVLVLEDRIWLELEASFLGPIRDQLERYIIADDVTLTDLSASWRRVSLEGEGAEAALASLGPLPEARYSGTEIRLAGQVCVAARYGFGSGEGVQFFIPVEPPAVEEAFREAMAGLDPAPLVGDAESFEVMRVLAGVPRLGAELDDSVLPDEAGLADAISTTKGCYTGQEVIARLRSRGRIKHQLVGLVFDGSVQVGDKLENSEKAVGEVTSVVRSESHGLIGLGFVKIEESEPGTALSANGAPAKVVELPFPDGLAA